MTTMNISLPDSLKSFVDEQVSTRIYVEHENFIDVWRVLHQERDLPAWMVEA